MPTTAIVTAADDGYFQHLLGFLQSISQFHPSLAESIHVIDLGMKSGQLQQLQPMVRQIVPGRWDFDFPSRAQSPRSLQGMTARPFLRDYFPGFEQYAWIDADTWLQDSRAVELLVGDPNVDIAIIPEIHWAYPIMYDLGGLKQFAKRHMTESFGDEAARHLETRACFNAGVFCMRRESPIWERYRQFLQLGYNRQVNHWTEQTAMNLAIYSANSSVRLLPAWCNWLCCYALPRFDPERVCLCEPTPPHDKLSLIHVAQVNKPGLMLPTTTGTTVEMPLDALGFKRAAEAYRTLAASKQTPNS